MKFRLTVKKKLSVTEFTEAEAVMAASADGTFEAQAINFAKTACNAYVREWAEGIGVKMRSQKDWVKNAKTKAFEKAVMVQNGAAAENYVFVLEEAE